MSEVDDNLEMIFIAEMIVQRPPKGSITTFQRLVDGLGNVTSTQTASMDATSTKNFNITPENGGFVLTGTSVNIVTQGLTADSGSYVTNGTDLTLTVT